MPTLLKALLLVLFAPPFLNNDQNVRWHFSSGVPVFRKFVEDFVGWTITTGNQSRVVVQQGLLWDLRRVFLVCGSCE